MKKKIIIWVVLLISICILGMSSISNAQSPKIYQSNLGSNDAAGPVNKGSFLLSGSFSYSYDVLKFSEIGAGMEIGDGKTSYKNLSIRPVFGYFITKGFMIGSLSQYSYNSSNSNFDLISSTSTNYWSIGPILGYYFDVNSKNANFKGNNYPYFEFSYLHQIIKNKNNKSQINSILFNIGLVHMVTESIGLDVHYIFQYENYSEVSYYDNRKRHLIAIGFKAFAY